MSDRSRYGTALVVSLMLHLALLLQGQRWWVSLPPAADEMLEVELLQLPPAAPAPRKAPPQAPVPPPPAAAAIPESRIVPMPEDGIERPSDEARFLSDRDNVVREEKVKRGDAVDTAKAAPDEAKLAPPPPVEQAPLAAADEPEPVKPAPAKPEPPAAKQQAAPNVAEANSRKPVPAAAPRAAAPGAAGAGKGSSGGAAGDAGRAGAGRQLALADLLPRVGDVDLSGAAGGGAAPEPKAPPKRDLVGSRAVRFSSGTGIATMLPSVRDGDVTMLNTKAHQFAPFVRRVAGRVFQHLVIALHEAARRGVSGSGTEVGVVHATMSADGSYLRAELREAHSDTRMAAPRVLMDIVGPRTFFDENPPEGAAGADGDIHFELQVRLRVQTEDRGSTGGRRPMTMFEGYFGVGLLD